MKLPGTVGARNVAQPFVYLDAGDHADTDKINILHYWNIKITYRVLKMEIIVC